MFAVDIVKHDGRYFIYIPFMPAPWSKGFKSFANIHVIHAPSMRGPWSEPIDLGIGGLIDPGHAVGDDGTRWLFLSGVNRVKLGPDGLSTAGRAGLRRLALSRHLDWTADGWFRSLGGDLSRPLPKPGGRSGPHGLAGSDDFTRPAFGTRWSFFGAAPGEVARATVANGVLTLAAKGNGPQDCAPLTQIVGDRAYRIDVDVEVDDGAQGGLLLFFNDRLFLGMGVDGERMTTCRGGKPSFGPEPAPKTRRMRLRIVNDRQIVTFHYSTDGRTWTRHGVRSEVSGYNANTVDDLQQLRPALFACGKGRVRFRDIRYRALP